MKFGPLKPAEALGGVAVHSLRAEGLVLKKGTRIGPAEIDALQKAGIESIVVAQIEPGDIGEDEAAAAIAKACAGAGVRIDDAFTGRANLYADHAGVLHVDRASVDRLNRVDEAITFATLPEFKPVVAGEMIGTVKIVPFGLPADLCARATAMLEAPPVAVAPYRLKRIGVVSTVLPGLSDKVIEKTLRVTQDRLAPAGASIVAERRVAHDIASLTAALNAMRADKLDLTIIFGASAIADRRDVIPASIVAAGGVVEHFGMPVDPGNLMLVGALDGAPVIGAPGCARSPKENGFDWILHRLLAGLPAGRDVLTGMGVGGLLMEIVTRPQPRGGETEHGRGVAAIILAAGRSSRMQGRNKLLESIDGEPMVRRVATVALTSHASPVIVVTGNQADAVREALRGLNVQFAHNADFAAGLSTSLRAGIAAVPSQAAAAVAMLGDMPDVDADLLNAMIDRFDPEAGALIVVPVSSGQRGNPVIWARRFFPDLAALSGDIGARNLIAQNVEAVAEVAAGEGALRDIDTPEQLDAARNRGS